MKRKAFLSIIPLTLLGSCSGAGLSSSSANLFAYNEYFFACDTTFVVRYFKEKEGSIEDQIRPILSQIDLVADPYYVPQNGEITVYTLNSTEEPVEVDDTLLEILQASLDAQKKTDGYYNPLIGEVSLLWKNSLFGGVHPIPEHVGTIPEKEKLDAAMERMNSTSIDISGHTVTKKGKARLDFGGIAKGYALEKLEAVMKENNISRYLIIGGTSSLLYGGTYDGGSWDVDVSYTDAPFHFDAKDCTSSLSAIYEQYRVIDGERYSHVVNPKTGMATSPYSMALVKGANPAYLDALSTALMMADLDTVQKWEQRDNLQIALFSNVPNEDPSKDAAHLEYATPGFQKQA